MAMVYPRLSTAELGAELTEGIKKAFTFPFNMHEHCKPDDKTHDVYDRIFHLNGHLVVLYDAQLFPGLTFRALEVNAGDLNAFTQDVKFEVDIPTIGGYFYIVSEDKSVKPVHVRGSFKINYDTAIVKGIASFFIRRHYLSVSSMAIDFELLQKPRVTLYSHEVDGSMSQLDSDRTANGAKIAEEMWPNAQATLYWLLRNKLWDTSCKIIWNDPVAGEDFPIHDRRRRIKVAEVSNEIIVRLKRKLRATTIGGRLTMPDIDVMVAREGYPDVWGRFRATSGWLGDVASIRSTNEFAVHARSKDELILVGQIHFNDWKYCYDEYTMESDTGKAMGDIVTTLRDNEAFIEITAIRDENGKIKRKNGRFEYINAFTVNSDIEGLGAYCDWLEDYVYSWMHGLMNAGKSTLNDTITKCLNEVLEDVDLFGYWDDLYPQEGDNTRDNNCTDDRGGPSDNDHRRGSEGDSVGSSITNGWEMTES